MGILLSKNAVIMHLLSVSVLLVHPWYIVTKRKGSEPLKKLGTRINTGADNRTRTYDLLITNERVKADKYWLYRSCEYLKVQIMYQKR